MVWMILTFVFGWLLCGAWGIRMAELEESEVWRGFERWFIYLIGPLYLVVFWFFVWPLRIRKFLKVATKGTLKEIKKAWQEAMSRKVNEVKKR